MPKNRAEIYEWHVCNLQAVQKAIGDIARLARDAIARCNARGNLQTLLCVHAFLIGVWAETRLKKILYEENGFSEEQRASIERSSGSAQFGQWEQTVDLAFCLHHNVAASKALDKGALGEAAEARFKLRNLLKKHLRAIIQIRNSLAHGQWIYPLTHDGASVRKARHLEMGKENLLSLSFKYAMIRHLTDAVHDLVISRKTFDSDFEKHCTKLRQAEINLRARNYTAYEKALIARMERGRRERKS